VDDDPMRDSIRGPRRLPPRRLPIGEPTLCMKALGSAAATRKRRSKSESGTGPKTRT
jgi:hypothetical protein